MNELEEFVSKKNYAIEDKFFSDRYLYEYDIRHANISMLHESGIIDENTYNYLLAAPKMEREVVIGNWIRAEKYSGKDKKIKRSPIEDAINVGIAYYKFRFCDRFGIKADQIVRIANDALTIDIPYPVDGSVYAGPISDNVDFKLAGIYTSMCKLGSVWLLFNSDSCSIDIKGISDDKIFLHEPFLTAICEIIMYIEKKDKQVALMKHKSLYESYINRFLPIEYYRELNSGSGFKINYDGILSTPRTARLLMVPDQFSVDKLDISYNLYILRELYSIILDHTV